MSHKFDDMTEVELREFFRKLADTVKAALPKDTGFLILATPNTGKGADISQYVSNVRREDAIKWMDETAKRWKTNDFVDRTSKLEFLPRKETEL